MKGASRIREQGYKDPLLVKLMKDHGFDEIPLYKHRPPNKWHKDSAGRIWQNSAMGR